MTEQAGSREESLHGPIFKGIEFDAFRKSAPLTRYEQAGRDGDESNGSEVIKGIWRIRRNEARRDWMGTG